VRIRKPLYALAPVVVASAVVAGRRLLARGGFDVVHVHWVIPNGAIGASVAGDLPLVVGLHGSDVAVAERSALMGRAARWPLRRAAAVVAPSRDLLDRAVRLGARQPALELVPYGADVDALTAAPELGASVRARLGVGADDLVVMGIGRLIPVKGFDVLLEAHALARREEPGLRLVLVGEGELRDELRRRADALGVAGSVLLPGAAQRAEIPAYLAAADIVAVPSVRHGGYVDGLPNVALEAMAAGRPLVASRVGGLPDLVRPGATGLLVEEKDATALAHALLDLARDRELRLRLGVAGREEIRTSRSWHSVGERLVEIYERVAAT
jgi:glycosyltransferase involved in cell wall biosynthesis